MICLQLCNYTSPQFVLLRDEGIAQVLRFLINPDEYGSKTSQNQQMHLRAQSVNGLIARSPTCVLPLLITVNVYGLMRGKKSFNSFCQVKMMMMNVSVAGERERRWTVRSPAPPEPVSASLLPDAESSVDAVTNTIFVGCVSQLSCTCRLMHVCGWEQAWTSCVLLPIHVPVSLNAVGNKWQTAEESMCFFFFSTNLKTLHFQNNGQGTFWGNVVHILGEFLILASDWVRENNLRC